ncbi:oxidative stress defense protein [Photobacterium alginatilyticum]|uniref:Oxidative stress defense protein n=1 Tax=Photobacterium alginatilyticum TaxID=1775171 RepID=A0ABW9YKS7_9GAMM|nr:oxidative stress defense protein [Photobacterium alginatilyticum]NBI54391.1 oxidative stress defense protein [Photobacterium alginatilyticum]
MKKQLLAVVLGCSALGFAGTVAANVTVPHLETIGSGEVTAQPDMAEFSVAVEEVRGTAKEAKQAVDKAVTAFVERLQAKGVERSDIQSANISLQPQYHYPKDKKPELTGYRASRHITVTVRDLEQLNTYLDNALGDGINRINNIQLRVSNEAEYVEQARQAAIKDAMEKAESLAKGFGEKIDGVWRITYQVSHPRPVMMRMAMDAAPETAATYQDAQITIRDRVEVVFKLEE